MPNSKPQQKSSKCFVYSLALFVVLFAILLTFSLIVLRTKSPDVKLSSVTVKNLTSGTVNGNSSSPFFNVTISTEIVISNSNLGNFQFENCSEAVLCEGVKIGEKVIGDVNVPAKGRKTVNVRVDLRSELLPAGKNLTGDIDSGRVKLIGYGNFKGRIDLMKFWKKQRNSEMNCSMNLNLRDSKIEDLVCE